MNRIYVKVQVKAKKNEVKKIDNEHYKIFTTAVPENGKANNVIIGLLAEFLHVGKTKIKIVKGATSKEKIFEIFD